MESLGELVDRDDALVQVQVRWREVAALGREARTPRVQFIVDLFLAVESVGRKNAERQEQMQQMLAGIFSDSIAHVQLAALNLICEKLPSHPVGDESLGQRLLPGWFSGCTSASCVRSLLADDACRDPSTMVAALQTVAKLPRVAANLLGRNTPADVTSLSACANILGHVLFEGSHVLSQLRERSEDVCSQLLFACGRDGIHAVAQCLVDAPAAQLASALQLLPADVYEDIFGSLLTLVHKEYCQSVTPLEHVCRAFIGGASKQQQRRERLHRVINKSFLQKSADYRFARALVDMLERCWVETNSDAENPKEQFAQELLYQIGEIWAEPALIRQGHAQRITLLTRVMCLMLEKLGNDQQHVLTHVSDNVPNAANQESPLSIICRGISTYFDSTEPALRHCGMAVALQFSRVMNQTLAFEDFVDPFPDVDKLTDSTSLHSAAAANPLAEGHVCSTPQTQEEMQQLHTVIFGREAPDFADMDSMLAFFNPIASLPELFGPENILGHVNNTDVRQNEEYDSDDSELVPFDDAVETEEELRDVPKPRFLRICLDMLRLSSDKDGAFDKQLAALEAVPEILASDPYDANELAAPLLREVLRIENHAHEANNFSTIREKAMVALCVAQPAATVDVLVTAVQDKEYSLGTRIEVLACMIASANKLAGGSKSETTKSGGSSDSDLPSPIGLPSGMKIMQSRRKRTFRTIHTTRNQFAPVAYRYFYPVMHTFISVMHLTLSKNMPTSSLPSRALTSITDIVQSPFVVSHEDQAMLAVHLLTALTEFVRCCAPLAEAQVMARDLSALLRQLDIPADLGLRRATMLAWYICVTCLGENVDALTIDQCVRVARTQLENDPDPQARAITQGIIKEILGVIDPQNLIT